MRVSGLTIAKGVLGWCVWQAIGCNAAPAPVESPDGGAPVVCSQMHRDISKWQGKETDCGPAVTDLLELTPVGNHQLLMRKRFSNQDDLWTVSADGMTFSPEPIGTSPADNNHLTEGFTLVEVPMPAGSSAPLVLVYGPRESSWTLLSYRPQEVVHPIAFQGTWPTGFWRSQTTPWGHEMIGLEDGYVLDRDLGDGSSQLWRFVAGPDGNIQLQAPGSLVAGPQEAFRRGHRLVPLGGRQLLEWLPRSCTAAELAATPGGVCAAGSDFQVWSYSLDPAGALNPQVVSPASFWPDIGADSVVASDSELLYVWTRSTGAIGDNGGIGRLRAYPRDPSALALLPLGERLSDRLFGAEWIPPTAAPNIKRLLIVLQNGRSFDSYFGRYCKGLPDAAGNPPSCASIPDCCEGIPPTAPEWSTCVDPEADTGHRPVSTAECLRVKMDDFKMDEFAAPHASSSPCDPSSAPESCGDPKDVACAGTGTGAGAIATYHDLAAHGALADRFFQTYAYADGAPGFCLPDATTQNLLYLVSARFTPELVQLSDSPLLTANLAQQQVSWSIYAGAQNLTRSEAFQVPFFYDPAWSPYRSLAQGELEHDIAVGELPVISVVVPDDSNDPRSEAPGNPSFDGGITFVQGLASLIANSRYQHDTLVLVTYLTAGGFYDHVAPPVAPPAGVDGWVLDGGTAAVHYGPRVPLLALGLFARPGVVSHVPLEISSLTTFIEWNWLQGTPLKATASQNGDVRRFRDLTAANLGSLIDPGAAGVAVPGGGP